jgi:hypothetical protein
MPAVANIPQIQSVTAYALLQSYKVTAGVEITPPALDYQGKYVTARARKLTKTFAMKGLGDLPAALVVGVDASGDVFEDGKTIIDRTRKSRRKDGWNEWEASGTNYPHVVVAP